MEPAQRDAAREVTEGVVVERSEILLLERSSSLYDLFETQSIGFAAQRQNAVVWEQLSTKVALQRLRKPGYQSRDDGCLTNSIRTTRNIDWPAVIHQSTYLNKI